MRWRYAQKFTVPDSGLNVYQQGKLLYCPSSCFGCTSDCMQRCSVIHVRSSRRLPAICTTSPGESPLDCTTLMT